MLFHTSLIWFRFWRRKTYPWMTLAIATYKVFCLYGVERDRETRLMMALAKIDFVSILAFMNDLLW